MPPREIPKKFQGVERCAQYGDNTKICVTGGRYGWSAWLTSNDGRKLAPLSVGRNTRSPGTALRVARIKADRIRRSENTLRYGNTAKNYARTARETARRERRERKANS
jgi:hypothetical protein